MTLVRMSLGAARCAVRAGGPERSLGAAAPQPRPPRGLRRGRGRRGAVLLLLRGPAHAGRTAMLIEFTAPAAVVVFLWLRRGQRPGRMTLAGAGLAALGLVLVLDLVSGADLSVPGVLVVAGRDGGLRDVLHRQRGRGQRPPGAGPGVGRPAGRRSRARPAWSGRRAADAHVDRRHVVRRRAGLLVGASVGPGPGHGGAVLRRWHRAGRRLARGWRRSWRCSKCVASVCWAWLLLDELPGSVQLLGGLLILAGVVAVKLGERSVVVRSPAPA